MITNEQIEQVKQRLIEAYNPLAIYLFGSYAQGTQTEDSDLDLLIVIEDYAEDRYKDLVKGHKSLIGLKICKDLLLYNKKQFDECVADQLSLCHKVAKEGKKIYAKA